MSEPERLYRVPEVGQILHRHPQTVRALIKSGQLRGVRDGRHVLVPASAVVDYIDSLPDAAAAG